MATTPTNKPVPSNDVKDLLFNSEKMDEVFTSGNRTYTDRLGNQRLTIRGLEEAAVSAGPTVDAAVKAMRDASNASKEAEAARVFVEGASKSAADSAASAARAEKAASDAESVVDVEGTYPDIAAGLTATPVGKYFRIPQVNSNPYSFIYYKNVNGYAEVATKTPGTGSAWLANLLPMNSTNIFDQASVPLAYSNNADLPDGNVNKGKLVVAKGSINECSAIVPLAAGVTYDIITMADKFRVGIHKAYPSVGASPDVVINNGMGVGSGAGVPIPRQRLADRTQYFVKRITAPSFGGYLMVYFTGAGSRLPVFVNKVTTGSPLSKPAANFRINVTAQDVAAIGEVTGENIVKSRNLANPKYGDSRWIRKDSIVSDAYVSALDGVKYQSDIYSLFIPVTPGKKYTITKSNGNVLRVAFTYANEGDASPLVRVAYNDDESQSATVEAKENDYWMIVSYKYLPTSNPLELMIEEGDTFTEYEPFGYTMPLIQPIDMLGRSNKYGFPTVTTGKNLFDGAWERGFLTGNAKPNEPRSIVLDPGSRGHLAIIPVGRNRDVTISKTFSQRFRIAVVDDWPYNNMVFSSSQYVKDEFAASGDTFGPFTFNTGNNAFVVVYGGVDAEDGTSDKPEFMQVEYGKTKTAWETFGYQFERAPEVLGVAGSSGGVAEVGVGNANFILKPEGTAAYGAYQDSAGTIPATDDSEAIQDFIESCRDSGVLVFPKGRNYLVSRTFTLNLSDFRVMDGSNCSFITSLDQPIFHVIGSLKTDAGPENVYPLTISEAGADFTRFRTFGVNRKLGIGLRLEKTFGLRVHGNFLGYGRKGIEYVGYQRNLTVFNNHIFAHNKYGIHFSRGTNWHQGAISGNVIMHSWKNFYADDVDMYNVTISGNDIENGYWFFGGEDFYNYCNIHFEQDNGIIQDLRIQDNTLEDHWRTDTMVILDGKKDKSFEAINITGNRFSNTNRDLIAIGGAQGVVMSGNTFGKCAEYPIRLIGFINVLSATGNTFEASQAGMLAAQGDFDLWNVSVMANVMGQDCQRNPVLIDVSRINNLSISGNTLSVAGKLKYDVTKGAIDIRVSGKSGPSSVIRVDDNNLLFSGQSGITLGVVTPDIKSKSVKGNLSDIDLSYI